MNNMQMFTQVSIIIVNYNNCALLKDCLSSIYFHTNNISFEVFVSDNGSTDGSQEMVRTAFPQVRLIENKKNIGFGAANNRALHEAKGKYIFYLNNDTILNNNAVKYFYDYFELHGDEKIGALGCMLRGKDGSFIHSAGTFPGFHLSIKQLAIMFIENFILSILYLFHIDGSILKKRIPAKKINAYYGDVDFVTGADLFVKNNPLAYFDERYFLYSEDSTLQLQMKKKDLLRRIIIGPEITHLCGASAGTDFTIKRKASFSRIQFEISRIRFLCDRYGRNSLFVVIAKCFVLSCWCNPILIGKTRHVIPELIRI